MEEIISLSISSNDYHVPIDICILRRNSEQMRMGYIFIPVYASIGGLVKLIKRKGVEQ